jgi:hypothetical protein
MCVGGLHAVSVQILIDLLPISLLLTNNSFQQLSPSLSVSLCLSLSLSLSLYSLKLSNFFSLLYRFFLPNSELLLFFNPSLHRTCTL